MTPLTSPAPTPVGPVRRALTEPARRQTWTEFAYAVAGLPVAVAGFVLATVTLSVGGGLAATFVGLPMLALGGLGCRWLGNRWRITANRVLDAGVDAPASFRARPGVLGWLGSCLSDSTAWRSRLYLAVKLPVAVVGAAVTVAFWAYGLAGTTYWAWRPFLPCASDAGSGEACHRGAGLGPDRYLDTAPRILLVTVAGVLILLAAPWAVRTVLQVDRLLVRALLGPTGRTLRVDQLERTRAAAVDDSAATLRRIERDLHDGAQARMVSVAMNVGLAREKLAEGADPAAAVRLLDTAHSTAKLAVIELRDLARGIHPPVLDAGLDAAFATLVSHSPVPVRTDVSITDRPDPSIETMAYFCVAELLTNVAKHSGATDVTLTARTSGDRLLVGVTDDGRGGAVVGAGSGLRGLTDRIATVDGRLRVDSPVGGPTTVGIDVPLRSRT